MIKSNNKKYDPLINNQRKMSLQKQSIQEFD